MHNRENLTAYEVIPEDLAIYMSHNGPHFNKAACDFAVAQMYVDEDEDFTPFTKEQVNGFLQSYGVKVKNNKLYDSVYVANMCKADYLGDSVPTEEHVARYIKNTLDDPDGVEGLTFNRWIADMKWLGIPIPWDDFL